MRSGNSLADGQAVSHSESRMQKRNGLATQKCNRFLVTMGVTLQSWSLCGIMGYHGDQWLVSDMGQASNSNFEHKNKKMLIDMRIIDIKCVNHGNIWFDVPVLISKDST